MDYVPKVNLYQAVGVSIYIVHHNNKKLGH